MLLSFFFYYNAKQKNRQQKKRPTGTQAASRRWQYEISVGLATNTIGWSARPDNAEEKISVQILYTAQTNRAWCPRSESR